MADELKDGAEEEISLVMPEKTQQVEEILVEKETDVSGEENESDLQKDEEQEQVQRAAMIIREGDIFMYENSVIALTVLSVSRPTSVGKMYKVRTYASLLTSIEVNEDQLLSFIENEGLIKIDTYLDQIEAVAEKVILTQGQVFTKEGNFFVEILTEPLWYVDGYGEPMNVVGTRSANEVVAFRSMVEVVASVYGNSDQFPSQN